VDFFRFEQERSRDGMNGGVSEPFVEEPSGVVEVLEVTSICVTAIPGEVTNLEI
jgi:hypothetical protein